MYARIGTPICPNDGTEISSQTIDQMADKIMENPEKTRIQILAPIVKKRKKDSTKGA